MDVANEEYGEGGSLLDELMSDDDYGKGRRRKSGRGGKRPVSGRRRSRSRAMSPEARHVDEEGTVEATGQHISIVAVVTVVVMAYLGLLPLLGRLVGGTVAAHAASLYDKMTGITRVCLALGIILLVIGVVAKVFPVTNMVLTVAGINPPIIGIGLLLFWYFGSDYTVATSQMVKRENVRSPTFMLPFVPAGYTLPVAFLVASAWKTYRLLHV